MDIYNEKLLVTDVIWVWLFGNLRQCNVSYKLNSPILVIVEMARGRKIVTAATRSRKSKACCLTLLAEYPSLNEVVQRVFPHFKVVTESHLKRLVC